MKKSTKFKNQKMINFNLIMKKHKIIKSIKKK